MITATLERPPTQVPTEESAESRMQEYHWLIHDACYRCLHNGDDLHGLDIDDLIQEARLEVWRALHDHPTVNNTFVWKAAYWGAIKALRRNRRSVDRPLGGTGYEVVRLETLTVDTPSGEPLGIEDALARHRRRREIPDPTQDTAVAHIMREELEAYLTPRRQQVLGLLLQGYTVPEIADVLGVSSEYTYRVVMAIRLKAASLWELQESRVDPSLSFRRCYERHRDEYNANRRAKRQRNPEEYNARRRATRPSRARKGGDSHERLRIDWKRSL